MAMTETDSLTDGPALPEDAGPEVAPSTSLLEGQPAVVIGVVLAVVDALIVSTVDLPEWLMAVLVAVTAVAGALGIRSKVTPVARPRLDDDTPLAP